MLAPRMCCLDLDTFFVSVERLLDPRLRGRPVVVGGARWGRGVVTSTSYEVRGFGVRAGMSIREASERAPADAVFLAGHGEAYADYSRKARLVVERFSPIVVAASIDEHYLDFRGCERLYRQPGDADDDATILRTVRAMTAALDRELGLPASAGIATSKPMAKVASALAKPQGVLLVGAGTEPATLAPLAVRRLPGIGPVAEARLHAVGIVTLGQLVDAPEALLRPIFGASTASIRATSRGEGADELGRERPAFREHDPHGTVAGTISNERTFVEASARTAGEVLSGLCERVGSRARHRGVLAGQLTLRLRYADFHTITRGRTITPTSVDVELHRVALELYREARTRAPPIRLLGVALAKLRLDAVQLPLFDAGERRGLAVDRVRDRFGYHAVHLASSAGPRRARRRTGRRRGRLTRTGARAPGIVRRAPARAPRRHRGGNQRGGEQIEDDPDAPTGPQLAVADEPDRDHDHRWAAGERAPHGGLALTDLLHHHAQAHAPLRQLPLHQVVLGAQREAVVGERIALGAQPGSHPAGVVEVEHVAARGERRGRPRVADPVEVARGGVQVRRAAFADEPADQIITLRAVVADRDVRLATPQVAGRVRRHDLELDAGVEGAQVGDDGRQQVRRDRLARGEADDALERLRLTRGDQRAAGRGVVHRPHLLDQLEASRRQREPRPHPLEQRDAQLGLERRDLPTQGRLGQAQRARRRRERARLRGDQERTGAVPVEGGVLPVHA